MLMFHPWMVLFINCSRDESVDGMNHVEEERVDYCHDSDFIINGAFIINIINGAFIINFMPNNYTNS